LNWDENAEEYSGCGCWDHERDILRLFFPPTSSELETLEFTQQLKIKKSQFLIGDVHPPPHLRPARRSGGFGASIDPNGVKAARETAAKAKAAASRNSGFGGNASGNNNMFFGNGGQNSGFGGNAAGSDVFGGHDAGNNVLGEHKSGNSKQRKNSTAKRAQAKFGAGGGRSAVVTGTGKSKNVATGSVEGLTAADLGLPADFFEKNFEEYEEILDEDLRLIDIRTKLEKRGKSASVVQGKRKSEPKKKAKKK